MRPPTALPVVANCAACAMRVAEHEVRPEGVPQPALPQHRFRGAAVRRHLGIGDREADSAARLHQARQAVEPLVDRERRSRRREDHEPADGVDDAGIARQAGRGQLIRKLLVGGEEHLERRAVLNLSRQRAGGAEHELDAGPPCARTPSRSR